MAALVQQLDHYSKVGIPKVHHQDYQVPFPFPEDEVEEGEFGSLQVTEGSTTLSVCNL